MAQLDASTLEADEKYAAGDDVATLDTDPSSTANAAKWTLTHYSHGCRLGLFNMIKSIKDKRDRFDVHWQEDKAQLWYECARTWLEILKEDHAEMYPASLQCFDEKDPHWQVYLDWLLAAGAAATTFEMLIEVVDKSLTQLQVCSLFLTLRAASYWCT